jgi:hypothetical protein
VIARVNLGGMLRHHAQVFAEVHLFNAELLCGAAIEHEDSHG